MSECVICGSNAISQEFNACEMMFGTREIFRYKECGKCESLQIKNFLSPKALQSHYPNDYYSFSNDETRSSLKNMINVYLQHHRIRYSVRNDDVLGYFICLIKPLPTYYGILQKLRVSENASILDVGCGGGSFLDALAIGGFRNLKGLDPYNSEDLTTKLGVRVDKNELRSTTGIFNVIMFHHVLEHVSNPVEVISNAREKMEKNGICIVRVPTSSSYAWRYYKENWVQLDPPRHLVIPSRSGMRIIGERSGLKLINIIDDSTAFQFWGSEQYSHGVSLLRNGVAKHMGQYGMKFSKRAIHRFAAEAENLNAQGRGDQAIFVFQK